LEKWIGRINCTSNEAGDESMGKKESLYQAAMEEFERDLLLEYLKKHDYIKVRAAAALGMKEQTLRYRLRKLGVRVKMESKGRIISSNF
jgi:transcriptional regulator with GAF, ATPase, and Fis domain